MVAVKCIKKSSLNKVSVENLLQEIEILKQIKHEHVVELIDFQVCYVFVQKCFNFFAHTEGT